jgi:hypothetical protein
VEHALQRGDRRDQRSVDIRPGADRHPRGEGRGVQPVLGEQHHVRVERAGFGVGGGRAVQHEQDIGGVAERWIGRQRRQPAARAVPGSDQCGQFGRHLQADARRAGQAGIVRAWVELRQRRDHRPQRVHAVAAAGRRGDQRQLVGGQRARGGELFRECR